MMLQNLMIRTREDLEDAVRTIGILPYFKNVIPGFSIEEHVAPEFWFSDQEGVWEWKGPVIRNTGCAYGKFFGNKAVFISMDWFPDFANWRRDGYDFDARFDDELASYSDKRLFDLLDAKAPVLSKDLKKAGGYRKGGNAGFDTVMNRLQAQGYALISDFVYQKDRFGHTYGWGTAQYSTPEKAFGAGFTDRVYQRTPEASRARIFDYLRTLFPDCDQKTIERFMGNALPAKAREAGCRYWLVPSNLKYYDVIGAFREEEVIHWKQGSDNIREGDIVFLYVGVPYSAVLYRCEVLETDIPWYGKETQVNIKKLMKIRRLDIYDPHRLDREVLKKYGVVTVRGTRSAPADMVRDLMRSGKN